MKKLFLACLLLGGCASHEIEWQNIDQVTMAQTTISLESNLWVNMMPTITMEDPDAKPQTIFGSLQLQSSQQLPADLNVEQVAIRQGEQYWLIKKDQLDIRSHSPNEWEIAFKQPVEINTAKKVDIAVQLSNSKEEKELFNNKVKVDFVY